MFVGLVSSFLCMQSLLLGTMSSGAHYFIAELWLYAGSILNLQMFVFKLVCFSYCVQTETEPQNGFLLTSADPECLRMSSLHCPSRDYCFSFMCSSTVPSEKSTCSAALFPNKGKTKQYRLF